MSTIPGQSTTADGPSGQLATWITGFTLGQARPDVQERARHLILDGLGCALVGALLPWSDTAPSRRQWPSCAIPRHRSTASLDQLAKLLAGDLGPAVCQPRHAPIGTFA